MPFKRADHSIEEWLRLEEEGLLQKIAQVFDDDSNLTAEYKTRVDMVPEGNVIPYSGGQKSVTAVCLYRAYSYNSAGNVTATIPELVEWIQDYEDQAIGALPVTPPPVGGPDPSNPPSSGLVPLRDYDDVVVTNPDDVTMVVTYLKDSEVVLIATITYADASRCEWVSTSYSK